MLAAASTTAGADLAEPLGREVLGVAEADDEHAPGRQRAGDRRQVVRRAQPPAQRRLPLGDRPAEQVVDRPLGAGGRDVVDVADGDQRRVDVDDVAERHAQEHGRRRREGGVRHARTLRM